MASIVQFEQPTKPAGKLRAKPHSIDPKLKAFIDRTVVPILVGEYLELIRKERCVAPDAEDVALYPVSHAVAQVVR